MKLVRIILMGLVCLISVQSQVVGQVLTRRLLERPRKYLLPSDTVDLLSDLDTDSHKAWLVYSDRDNNQTFTTPEGVQVQKTVGFLDEFYAVGEEGEYLRLAKDPEADLINFQLSSKAEDYGWIRKTNLLLWKHCLVTAVGQISKKIMVLNTADAIKNMGNDGHSDIVEFRLEPREGAKRSGYSSELFQFFFMMKKEGDWILLARDESIPAGTDAQRKEEIVGWAPQSRLTFWDHRKAVEPNWLPEAAMERRNGRKAIILSDEPAAKTYSEGKTVPTQKIFWDGDPFAKRNVGEWRRFPVLKIPRVFNRIYIGAMGSIYSPDGEGQKEITSSEHLAEVQRRIDNLLAAKRKVNIVFVVDGTTSMGPFLGATRNAIRKCISTLKKSLNSNNTFKFGVAIYRDYPEGDRIFEFKPLQENVDELYRFLDPAKAIDYHDTDEPEAVYYGMKKALYTAGLQKNEANILILIGDAGNHHRQDPSQVDQDEIVRMLSAVDCHFLAFQVHFKDDPAYPDFVKQAKEILEKTSDLKYKELTDAFSVEISKPEIEGVNNQYILKNGSYVGGVFGLSKGAELDPKVLTDRVSDAIVQIGELNDRLIAALKKVMDGSEINTAITTTQKSDEVGKYTNNFASGIFECLRQAGIKPEELEFLKKEKFQLYQPGWIAMTVKGQTYPLFKYVLFLTKTEFSRLVNTLEDLENSRNTREDLQKAWTVMLRNYVGSMSEREIQEKSLQDLSEMVFGLPSMNNFLSQVNVADIIDPKRFPDVELNKYINDIDKKFMELRKIFNMNTSEYPYAFRSNEIAYYWIDEDLLP